jgi:hypothetical protein
MKCRMQYNSVPVNIVYYEVNNWWFADSRQVGSGLHTHLFADSRQVGSGLHTHRFNSQPRHQLTLTEILYGFPQSLHADAMTVTQIRLSVIPSTAFTVHYSLSKLLTTSRTCAAHFIRVCTQGTFTFIKASIECLFMNDIIFIHETN